MELIEPLLADDGLLADIDACRRDAGEHLDLWWLGQSGFLVVSQGRTWLFDPYLSDSLTRKYASTDKPHVRMTRRCVDPARLTGTDVVSSSHRHTDHLDAETIRPLWKSNPQLTLLVPRTNLEFAAERLETSADRLTGIREGQTLSLGPFRVTAVPAAHESLEPTPHGFPCLGYVVDFGSYRVYHSGDTIGYPGMVDWLRPLRIDVALLPINGCESRRRVAGNLWGDEAAQLAHAIGAACAVPCHYEMFTFNTASPDLFIRTCEELGQPYRVLQCGERLRFPPPT